METARVADVVAGHRQVVLISGGDPNRLEQHTAVIEAAAEAELMHPYYTTGLRADDARFEISADHNATEDVLIASGLTYTILRNGWSWRSSGLSSSLPRRKDGSYLQGKHGRHVHGQDRRTAETSRKTQRC